MALLEAEVKGEVTGYRERLVKFVAAQSIELRYSEEIGPAKGLSQGGKITLLSGMQPAEEFSVLVYEIGHEMLHRRTPLAKPFLDTGSAFSDYIALWNGDANLLRESLEAVEQTAAVILGSIAPEPVALAATA